MEISQKKRIVILGGSFAGLTAAYELQRELGDRHQITVIDKNERFVFIPSLIWVPFGWRTPEQISFPLQPALQRRGIDFLLATADRIDIDKNVVAITPSAPQQPSDIPYDYLLVATGPHVEFSAVPGLGPHGGFTHSICTVDHALEAGRAWQAFVKDPGPVIIGATQGAACFGAAYEFAFNLEYAARRAGIRDKVHLTFVTAESFAGHFGIGGMKWAQEMTEWFFRHVHIDWVVDAVMEKVTPGNVHLAQGKRFQAASRDGTAENVSGQTLPFKYAMIIPPFLGVETIRRSGLGNERGFVVVDEFFRHHRFANIFAAGVSVAVAPPAPCAAGCAVPKTGYISEVMAKYAAHNIAASIQGKPLKAKPTTEIDAKCLLDAGNQGIIMYTDRIYAPKKRRWEVLIPGPWAHWMKVGFEKYFIWKMRTGRVNWP